MKGRRFIVTWLWMLALLLSGCFNPGYGAGGFLCEKGGCPPGYGCTCQQGKSVCIKGAPDSPCNKGADLGLDGPPKGDGPSGFHCAAIEEVVEEGLAGPATFDLTLDKNGNPFVVYADVYSSLHTKSKKRQDTSWPAKGIMVTALKTSRMAAAINQRDHLSVAFSAIGASSGTKPTIHHTYMDLANITGGWQGLKNLDKDMGVEDLDLVGSLTEGTILHLMVTGNTVTTDTPHVLVVELKPPGGSGPYSAVEICKMSGGHFASPRLAMGKHQGSLFTATALHDEDSQAWHVTRFTHGAVVGCVTPSTVKGAALSSPLALAVDSTGSTHLAYSQVETSSQKQKQGGLSCGVWPGSISSPPNTLPRVRHTAFVDSLSVDLVVAPGDRSCATFWEYNDKKNVLELKISCMASKASPHNWTDSMVIDTIDVPVSEFKGYATHAMVDQAGMVHVAYLHHTMKPSERFSVRYTQCKP